MTELHERLKQSLWVIYVDKDCVEEVMDLSQVYTDPHLDNPQRQIKYIEYLEDETHCHIKFDEFRNRAASHPERYESLLLLTCVLVDITLRYPNIERRGVTRKLNAAIRNEGSVETAGSAILELAKVVALGDRIRDTIEFERLTHPEDTAANLQERTAEVVESGSYEVMQEFVDELKSRYQREWFREDLLEFTGFEFEELLAQFWRDKGNTAEVTQKRQDKGIDVVVLTKSKETLLIQAKRKGLSYSVGVGTVQRTNGALDEFGGDRAVVVTTSSFTGSAQETAKAIDRLSLIDGSQLCELLSTSSLVPPLRVGELNMEISN